MDTEARTLPPLHRQEWRGLEYAVEAARKAEAGDYNDVEIDALKIALDEALLLLGREDLR